MNNTYSPDAAIIGAGPAGLMAAEILAGAGCRVSVYERMATPARKFLMAGRGGLNLTHSEALPRFLSRYGASATLLRQTVEHFPPAALRAWCDGLGETTFVGSSGRVFPKSFKASPLLRAWMRRLGERGARLFTRHDWRGWDEAGKLSFHTPQGALGVQAGAVLLALGGASWPRLGADGSWAALLQARGVCVNALQPANCGFAVTWSRPFTQRFAGAPLKSIVLHHGGKQQPGEAMITAGGIEGGAVYALSRDLRETIARQGEALLEIDLRPNSDEAQLRHRLEKPRAGQSMANFLRKQAGLDPLAVHLMREATGNDLPHDPAALAGLIKCLPLRLTGVGGLERAISTAGGVAFEAVDDWLMLRALPGLFVAGEMLDWEAPTGGYLLQAAFATGARAAHGMLRHLGRAR